MLQTFKKGALDPSMDGMLEIQLSRSMICHVSNTRWNTEYVCPVPSDIVCGVVFVKGAALCNVTILIGHTWWIVVIPPVTHSEMVWLSTIKDLEMHLESVTECLQSSSQWPLASGWPWKINSSPPDHLWSELSNGFPWIHFSGLGYVCVVLICCLQIYGYVSSICTKAKTLLSVPASVADILQM